MVGVIRFLTAFGMTPYPRMIKEIPHCVRRFLPAVETGTLPLQKKVSVRRGGCAAPTNTNPQHLTTPVIPNAVRNLKLVIGNKVRHLFW